MKLTERQKQVLERMARGLTDAEIAAELGIGAGGVAAHRQGISAKLKVWKRDDVVDAAVERGLIDKALLATRRPRLSKRQVEALRLMARGMDTRQIASALSVSTRTAENCLENAYIRLKVTGSVEAIMEAMRYGIVPLEIVPAQ